MTREQVKLTLLSRTYCHLCHDMEAAMALIASEFDVTVDIVDVDSDDALESRWGELVPVLLHGDTELCHYFLDTGKVRDYLSKIR